MRKLSLRLNLIADLVPHGAKVCDIGTDHAYLPIFLKKSGRCKTVIATDINKEPLNRAAANITAAGVHDIQLRLCDGLSKIKAGEVDTVIIAGIGGEAISAILEQGGHIAKDKNVNFILQPTTSPDLLRLYLSENGFDIIKEIPVLENGKVYSIMLCRYTGEIFRQEPYFFFAGLVKPNCEAGIFYLKKQQQRCCQSMTALKDRTDKKEEFEYYKTAFEALSRLLSKGD
ncbi:MAG: class I SAM-dependent methyltransferase [Acutalibacteraceae bacterium]|jgi:tRNA (adenine22-N1)-methyltransferase